MRHVHVYSRPPSWAMPSVLPPAPSSVLPPAPFLLVLAALPLLPLLPLPPGARAALLLRLMLGPEVRRYSAHPPIPSLGSCCCDCKTDCETAGKATDCDTAGKATAGETACGKATEGDCETACGPNGAARKNENEPGRPLATARPRARANAARARARVNAARARARANASKPASANARVHRARANPRGRARIRAPVRAPYFP